MLEQSTLPDADTTFSLANAIKSVKHQVSSKIVLPLREQKLQPGKP